MAEGQNCVVDLREMGDRYGLKMRDVVKDGKVIMRDHAWTPEALRKAVKEVEEKAKGYEIIELRGHVPNWVVAALAYAAHPATAYFEIGPKGMYHLTATPFPIDAKEPTAGYHFDVKEDGDFVYVQALTDNPHADAHGFDMSKFDEMTMPVIPAGKNVLLSGETVNPVAVSMVLAYAEISNSVSIRFHQEPGYFCSVTHDPKIEIGHMFPTND
jgi:hypothetical protein